MLGQASKVVDGRKADIWACGVTLYNLLTNTFPHTGKTFYELQENVQTREPNFEILRSHGCSQPVIDLLKGLLDKDESKRMTICQILQDPWVTQNGQDPVDLDLSQTNDDDGDCSRCSESHFDDQASYEDGSISATGSLASKKYNSSN